MSEDTNAPAAVNPVPAGLFHEPTVGGGDYWPAVNGSYIGELLRFEEGPAFDENGKRVEGEATDKQKRVRWVFNVCNMDGSQVTYVPAEGENKGKTLNATADVLTSLLITKKATAPLYFKALLGREVVFEGPNKDSALALMTASIGKKAMLVVGPNKNNKTAVVNIIHMG